MRTTIWLRPKALDEFELLIGSHAIRAVFQPIVELSSGDVVGYEALARPPAGSSYPDAASMFAEAYRRDRVGELDWACRAAVFHAALQSKVPPEVPLFVNVEPTAMRTPCPADLTDLLAAATSRRRFVLEVTERSLADDPAALLDGVSRSREAGMGVALDDVGAEPASLALMPLVAPDVIKLDLSLIQSKPNPDVARIVNAVLAESERTGARILAEGVESDRHVAVARSMGATLGQGWRFGAPARLPDNMPLPPRPLRLFTAQNELADTPFSTASRIRTPVMSTRDLLDATSRHLENEILHSSGKSVLLSSFEVATNFGTGTRRRYERLARQTVLTAVSARNMPSQPGLGIRGAELHPDDPLCREWTVVVIGSQFAAALMARRVDDSAPDGPGVFEAIITHDRDLVVAAARSFLSRVPSLAR